MQKIRYEFNDGTRCECEVSDEFYVEHTRLEKRAENDERRETRRHTSLTYFNDLGVDFEEQGADPLSVLVKKEDNFEFEKIFAPLSPAQRELLELVYIDGLRPLDIAKEQGVSKQAINNRLNKIFEKIQKSLKKGVD